MINHWRCLAAICLISGLTACGGTRELSSVEKQAISKSQVVEYAGRKYAVALVPSRKFAYVVFSDDVKDVWRFASSTSRTFSDDDPKNVSGKDLLSAGATASGCHAFIKEGSFLDFSGLNLVIGDKRVFSPGEGLRVGVDCSRPSNAGATTLKTPKGLKLEEALAGKIKFPGYPQIDRTYLSFDEGHGYQVNYLAAQGEAWLWYHGNTRGVPEQWRLEGELICFKHPKKQLQSSAEG